MFQCIILKDLSTFQGKINNTKSYVEMTIVPYDPFERIFPSQIGLADLRLYPFLKMKST